MQDRCLLFLSYKYYFFNLCANFGALDQSCHDLGLFFTLNDLTIPDGCSQWYSILVWFYCNTKKYGFWIKQYDELTKSKNCFIKYVTNSQQPITLINGINKDQNFRMENSVPIKFKNNSDMEKYLPLIKNFEHRKNLNTFRILMLKCMCW